MAELGQQTVDFSSLVSRTAEESFTSLKELVEKSKSSDHSDTEKKVNLLKYIVKTQQRMLRLNVLAKWCQQVPLIQYCQQLASTLSSHDTCFTQAADSLFFMHEGLQQARAPVYDVPSAVEVLLTGSYERLPKCIEDVGMQSSLTEDQQRPALKKLDTLVRSKLLEVTLPKEISEVKVADGTALIRVDGEFKVLVTLGYRGHLSLWRILHLELLVGERSGLVKLEEMRRHVLGDDLERRMSAAENPFSTLYSILHELCVALVMDTAIRQVQALRQGRWKDVIRFELISDGGSGGSTQLNQDNESDSAGIRTPGLKLVYWLDFDKNSGASDSGSCPYIKIEPGPDLQIKCQHSTFVIDPLTGKEAGFFLHQSCIDVEKLLLKAISCNRYTRLLEIQKELMKNVQICQDASDVVLFSQADEADSEQKDAKLDSKGHGGQELLRVRAYGSSFFTLGINIRNGRFLLQSSQNILAPSTLLECEETLNQATMTAADVFTSLRSKSILHLFATIGRFLGLEVYEHGFAAVKVPKNLMNGSAVLLMGFPDCESSYFLLMELDKDFKPVFKLLETQPDSSGKGHSFNDLNNVLRIKKIDIGQMQMLEDETNLSILDWGKLVSSLPNVGGPNQISEHDVFNLDGSMQIAGVPSSSFSSIVDEVFEIEKGTSATPFPSQKFSSFSSSPASHLSFVPMNLHSVKAGTPSPKWEAGMQVSQLNNVAKSSGSATHYDGSLYPSSGLKNSFHSASFGSLSSGTGRITSSKKLSASKSEQDLASLRSPHSVDNGVLDEDQLRLLKDTSKDALSASRSHLLSPPRPTFPRVFAQNAKPNGSRSSSPGNLTAVVRFSGASPLASPPVSQAEDITIYHGTSPDASKHDQNRRKRKISNLLSLIPSLEGMEANAGFFKRRKTSDVTCTQLLKSSGMISKSEAYSYSNLIAEANKGNAPSGIYVSALLHVVRHSSLCIKHAKLTSQMEELDIPYVEEVGLRNASLNIWFRLLCSQGDSWRHICLRLGRPGSMYWDVKINDQHFRDLWELQKGSTSTPWGSGIRIANTSHVDSHIRYDPDGVVLSYHSVESDSIKKLVADIRRLSNARTFSLGMWKLLGVRTEDKPEEGSANSDVKAPVVGKGAIETADKLSEQMRRSFRIEAVGLLSLWFCFGSGVLARFVVEWESGKEGCTMHVSPDQLWPHTKFLEDFIDGAEVASLLDCIRLTAGPLHALAAATRPARASPAPGVAGGSGAVSSMPKQSGYTPLQGLLPSSSTTNVNQAAAVPAGNTAASVSASSMGNHSLHGAAMLAAAGRGSPGIVPSSLLPIDVSVVLRGPYWIRIIYRKRFAVDMRCFAGDQVWLQPATPPATPPRGGSSVGGSLPCPQFRPFIMEHVAQELNGLDSGFTSGQQTVGPVNSNNTNLSSGPQFSANGNRVNLPTSAAMSRAANQVAGLNRVGNALPGSPNLAVVSSGLPIRRSPGSGVPAHVRGELNTAIIGLGDDGGYGGGWVPVVALKKVLRGILKYLGVLWLFAQLPELLKEILGSILKDNEGALLNLDQEQPALRFFVGGYVFAVSVHRVQLLLQVLSVKRFHHQQQQQQQQNNANAQEELTQSEISEICDYFSRRVASEPYDASRVASFITLLTLPISVLREFLKLIAWKKGLAPTQSGDIAPAQKPRIELCLENHTGVNIGDASESSSATKSNIHYDRPHNSVDFALTVVLDPAHIPHINTAGGAAWLPYCVSVRLRYSFGENPNVSFLGMEGSHGGRACWLRLDEWEKCKQRVARTIEVSCSSPADTTQGRLRTVADNVQRALICAFKD
ncbi:ARABIDOPSIS MEDIATOR COMPONENTS 14, MEDIATOR COMPONENTS 14, STRUWWELPETER [Hibiscus trionum]|uniref:Mediator of RNA polymerase II transcription subunit 14 n=1 Tax=Hibiscus trionum TaxID=183268 RepID=A0A9W7ICR2_HIBTR|nr:ARABIDOPSIS MEDIATOR COMPONENTS 14, MEDIATOR COMPONENTS 14, STRUWWELPETER [Hibiscus trionum]